MNIFRWLWIGFRWLLASCAAVIAGILTIWGVILVWQVWGQLNGTDVNALTSSIFKSNDYWNAPIGEITIILFSVVMATLGALTVPRTQRKISSIFFPMLFGLGLATICFLTERYSLLLKIVLANIITATLIHKRAKGQMTSVISMERLRYAWAAKRRETVTGFVVVSFAALFVVYEIQASGGIDSIFSALADLIGIEQPETVSRPVLRSQNANPPAMSVAEAEKFKSAADQGDAYAQFRTGYIYENGLGGFPKNMLEAERYYKLAIAQGQWKAETNLGMMYESGADGIPQNKIEAVRLYKLAVKAGDGYAASALGYLYQVGDAGLPQDNVEAVRLFKMAADQSYVAGQYQLAMAYLQGLGGLSIDQVEAARLFKLSAAQGYAAAQYQLGLMYTDGRGGLAEDQALAKRYLSIAADGGNAKAQTVMGVAYMIGKPPLPKKDTDVLAVKYFQRAAAQNEGAAENLLGEMYRDGRGELEKSDIDALRYYRLATEHGSAKGAYNLALMYENGQGGLEKDHEQALVFMREAATRRYKPAQEYIARIDAQQNTK